MFRGQKHGFQFTSVQQPVTPPLNIYVNPGPFVVMRACAQFMNKVFPNAQTTRYDLTNNGQGMHSVTFHIDGVPHGYIIIDLGVE
jgi:hypothetical protein